MMIPANEPRWYAVYTAPRAEKKVSERFALEGIEYYLALQKVKRRWSDRVKEVIVPVINGYIFVHIPATDFSKIVRTYGAIAFVKEGGIPTPIPDSQMKRLQFMIDNADEPVEYTQESFEHGEKIRISKGPLEGMMGELVEIKGKHKVMVRLERFGCAMTTVPASFIEKMPELKSQSRI